MIRRLLKNLGVYDGDAPPETFELERDGSTVIRGALTPVEVAELTAQIDAVFDASGPERGRTPTSTATRCRTATRPASGWWPILGSSR